MLSLTVDNENINVIQDFVLAINIEEKYVQTSHSGRVSFDSLCIATGANPNVIFDHPLVIGIRDTESVESLCEKLRGARKVVVVGLCTSAHLTSHIQHTTYT